MRSFTRSALVLGALVAACADFDAADSRPAVREPSAGSSPTLRRLLDRAVGRIREETSPRAISESLKVIAARPHIAGSRANEEVARHVERQFTLAGLETRREEYDVLLPLPEEITVEMVRPFAFRAAMREMPTDQDYDTHAPDVLPPFLAFGADGDVTGSLVYLNYARAEDFERLAVSGVRLAGRIGIARYGRTYRGAKALEAKRRGMSALLIYSDPADDGFAKGPEYPQGPWRPATAVQRGSVLDIATRPGDPLTPDEPAVEETRRIDGELVETLPGITAAPLSWADAEPMLRALEGPPVAEGWQGGLPFAYRVGGTEKALVRVKTQSSWERRRIVNVIGELRGGATPEESVVMGNHRDAWVHGAVDPGSGTAVLCETARVLGVLAREGLRPARTITLASFDAEEFGIIGSTEHVERHRERLVEGAALYLNCDAPVTGSKFGVIASPELRMVVSEALRALPDDRAPERTLMDAAAEGGVRWAHPGGGSDFVGFLHGAAVPVLEFGSSGSYGVYHSLFDTYGWMKAFGDPTFENHARVTRAVAATLWGAASATAFPTDAESLLAWIESETDALAKARPAWDSAPIRAALAPAREAARQLADAREQAVAADPDPMRLRAANRILVTLSRAFYAKDALKSRPFYRHLLIATDPLDGYGAETLPAIREALAAADLPSAAAATTRLAAAVSDFQARCTRAAALLAGSCDSR